MRTYSKILLYYHTIRYLKFIQIYYRVYYKVLQIVGKNKLVLNAPINKSYNLLAYNLVHQSNHSFKGKTFTFLNLPHTFEKDIDWEFMGYGKLWQYNLAYFDYLNQQNLEQQEGIELIKDFIKNAPILKSSIEPYPTSLRVINWIKFVSKYKISDPLIIDAIYHQVKYLQQRIEYHLLGNHLLENAFCLLHAGFFFKDESIIAKAKNILEKELVEQILADGGHFELSPMYHNIILFRVLEAIDLLRNNGEIKTDNLLAFLEKKTSVMLGWLNAITFRNGDMPLLNDATIDITLRPFELQHLGRALGIEGFTTKLSASGYRKYTTPSYEMIIDVGQIGPSYQPAHAHADTFNVIVYQNNLPFMIDMGISTYEANSRRQEERSTINHNTVTVENQNQSNVWGAFRVGERAEVSIITETEHSVKAQHSGYRKLGIVHERYVETGNTKIIIQDKIIGNKKKAVACFHFHPDIKFSNIDNQLLFGDTTINFDNAKQIIVQTYQLALGFNQTMPATKVVIEFEDILTTTIGFL
jgi:uncharacterized heparinase superfamily protein